MFRRMISEERFLKDTWMLVASSEIAIGFAIFLFASFKGYNFIANIANENSVVMTLGKYFSKLVNNL